MSRASLPSGPSRLRRTATSLAVAIAFPLTMGVSCDPGMNQEDQQQQQNEDSEDGGEEEDGEDD